MIKVGIIGVGTVGQSVVEILKANQDIIGARAGDDIVVTKGVVRNLNKKRDIDIALSDDVDFVLDDESIDIVVELMGGVEDAFKVVSKALQKGKAVVTANKALLAYHRYELQDLAQDTPFEYEASVAGGIPIIKALKDGLSANHIESLQGIMNGTCNYILTKMANEGADFGETLKEAQELGYAEADPTFDVGGFDAAHKLLILASIAYGIDAKPEDILIEGIEEIEPIDLEFAKEFGYVIKHLTIAKRDGNQVELKAHPTLIKKSAMIAKVDDVMNGVSVVGDKVGETMYYGAGAGGDATASAVISDIIEIVRGGKVASMLGFKRSLELDMSLKNPTESISRYYVRLNVTDKMGILSKIASIFAQNSLSIKRMLQKPVDSESANLLLSTHRAKELDIKKALSEIEKLEFVLKKPVMIRVEE